MVIDNSPENGSSGSSEQINKENPLKPIRLLYINPNGESKFVSVKNIFVLFREKALKDLLLTLHNPEQKSALIIGGSLFSASEILNVMKERPEIQLVLAVDPLPEIKYGEFFTHLKPEESFPEGSVGEWDMETGTSGEALLSEALPPKIGIVLPMTLESLIYEIKEIGGIGMEYIEMIAPNPIENPTNLVQLAINLLREGGEFRIYLSTQDMAPYALDPLYKLENPIIKSILSGKTSPEIIETLKKKYREILKSAQTDDFELEIEILSPEQAKIQRDSAHFGKNDLSEKVIIIKIIKKSH